MLTKKLFVFGWVVFAVLLVANSSVTAQKLYAPPKRLWLKGDAAAAKAEESPAVPIREVFYPIGWSKDGKFAFYVEPPDEACGCYFGHLVIQDMKTDKILWEREYEGEENGKETLRSYWQANRKLFSAKLAEYGIVAPPRFSLLNAAFTYGKDTFTPVLKDTTKMNDELQVSGDVVLSLLSKEKGGKTIYQTKFDPKEYSGFLGAELSGSLLSPFEPRAAVIMIENYRGYEGPPNITHIRVVGTSLTAGF